MRIATIGAAALAMALTACDGAPAGNESAQSGTEAANAAAPTKAALPSCPFREIKELRGSIEGGRLLVTGRVDLMMAGYRPQLTPRVSGTGALALDLALVPEANAGVSDVLRYERSGVGRYPRGEIWCGRQRLATYEIVLVG